jgi:hypothetical protein
MDVPKYIKTCEELEKIKAFFKPNDDYLEIGDNRLYFPADNYWVIADSDSANTDQS